MEIKIDRIETLPDAAEVFINEMKGKRLFAFDAPMGAGKTTFISELCRQLGCVDEASSPTFSIINEYGRGSGRLPVYHFDFYRIESHEEALDLGLDDYFDSGSLCFMEWADNVAEFIPEETVKVEILPQTDGARLLRWNI